jgi:transcription initiation factor TFIIE subunit alpha
LIYIRDNIGLKTFIFNDFCNRKIYNGTIFITLMLKNFLNEVISIVVGKPAEEIVALLEGDKYVNEFIIAKKLDLTINQARNILYKISDHGLVSSIRKKDKKKGWYTYFWKIEVLKSLEFLREIVLKNLTQLKNQIKSRETKRFYVCERCNIEFSEENAMLHDFTCNECGEVFSVKDNEKVIKEFKRNEEKLENKLKMIDTEINTEKEKLEKIKMKEIKKIENEKMKQREETRRLQKEVREKEKKKNLKNQKVIKRKTKPSKAKKSNKKIDKKIVKKKIKKTSKKK